MCNFFLSVNFIVSTKGRIFPLNMRNIIIYVAQWWEKYLSKHNPLKHTCWWCDKLILLLKRSYYLFLLDYIKIHKKQKLSALDIIESWSKEMWSISYVSCVNISVSFFNSKISIFILDAPTLKLSIILIILPTDQPKIILPTACTTKNKVTFA